MSNTTLLSKLTAYGLNINRTPFKTTMMPQTAYMVIVWCHHQRLWLCGNDYQWKENMDFHYFLTTVVLNWDTSSIISNMFYTKPRLFTEFTKYRKIVHCVVWVHIPSTDVHLYAGMSIYMQLYSDTFRLCNQLRAL